MNVADADRCAAALKNMLWPPCFRCFLHTDGCPPLTSQYPRAERCVPGAGPLVTFSFPASPDLHLAAPSEEYAPESEQLVMMAENILVEPWPAQSKAPRRTNALPGSQNASKPYIYIYVTISLDPFATSRKQTNAQKSGPCFLKNKKLLVCYSLSNPIFWNWICPWRSIGPRSLMARALSRVLDVDHMPCD